MTGALQIKFVILIMIVLDFRCSLSMVFCTK